jgi:uncharacterized protein YutE (UPF0331/DUF86 family)
MVDREKIEDMIRHLRQYTAFLQEIVAQDQQMFLVDPKSIGSARYYLQVSIETCIGIANHIIATERLRAPKDYRDSFEALSEAGILLDDFARTMQELAGLRNLLVHLYWEVDDAMIYNGIRSELGDFEIFIGHILAFIDAQGSNLRQT